MSAGQERDPLHGMRILILEDSFLVASELAYAVGRCGCIVLGPAASAKKALEILDKNTCDGAVLDLNLGGGTAEAVVARLVERGTPFLFLTGYSEETPMGERLSHVRLLRKPVDNATLCDAMRDEFVGRKRPV